MQKITIRSNVNGGNLKRNRNLIIDAIRSFEGKEVVQCGKVWDCSTLGASRVASGSIPDLPLS